MWLRVGLAAFGLGGLAGLAFMLKDQPWLRRGLWALVAWQGMWYVVRFSLVLRLWRREPALGAAEKWWMALTVPIYVLLPLCWRPGTISAWVEGNRGHSPVSQLADKPVSVPGFCEVGDERS